MTCEEVLESLAVADPAPELGEHLANCADCRGAEARYRLLREGMLARRRMPGPGLKPAVSALVRDRIGRRRLRLWAAAAAILVAAGALAYHRPESPRPPTPAAPASYPREIGPSHGVSVLALGSGSHVEAAAGSRARVEAPDRLSLSQGRVYLHATSSIDLVTPGARYSASAADFEVRVGNPPSVGLLNSAWADDRPREELTVVEGSVTVLRQGQTVQVGAGQLLRLGGVPEPASDLASRLSWRDGDAAPQDLLALPLDAWTISGKGSVRLERGVLRMEAASGVGQRMLRDASERFLWSAALRSVNGGYLEVCLPGGEILTLGKLPALQDGKPHVLSVRWDLAPVLTLDGKILQRLPRAAGPGAVGLGVVGGSLEMTRWQFQQLP